MLLLRLLFVAGLAFTFASRLHADGPAASRPEPLSFEGVQPGVSTLDDVFERLGGPRAILGKEGSGVYVFDRVPFERVEITMDKDGVGSITLTFPQPLPLEEAAAQFKLSGCRPVTVADEAGRALGLAYPEHGALLRFSPAAPENSSQSADGSALPANATCSHVVLGPILPHPFVLRAEAELRQSCTATLADADTALSLDPTHGAAHWLRGQVLMDTGRLEQAMTAADEAIRLEPRNPEFRLLRSRILEESGDFLQAVEETRRALADCTARPEVKCRALCQLGDQLAAGPQRDYRGAIEQHQQAIAAAEGLIADRRPAVRRAAERVLIDAHLAVAQDIAWGPWKNKPQGVAQWIDRASKLAKATIASGAAEQELWFEVSRRALAAHVGMQGAVDPSQWIDEALRSGRELIAAAKDPARRQQLEWALGTALYDALQIYLMANQYDAALRYGTLALSLLEGAAALHEQRPGHSYLMGRFYFRLGSIEVALNNDHSAAARWFSKAAPLLEKPVPNSALGDIGRQGESLVAIGVTLWQLNQRDEALRLTERGVELIEQAIEQGLLNSSALNAPYKNLASMHQELGNAKLAKAYQRLAAQPVSTVR
jgi:tetratricopeptide (TPR) repeat protein